MVIYEKSKEPNPCPIQLQIHGNLSPVCAAFALCIICGVFPANTESTLLLLQQRLRNLVTLLTMCTPSGFVNKGALLSCGIFNA